MIDKRRARLFSRTEKPDELPGSSESENSASCLAESCTALFYECLRTIAAKANGVIHRHFTNNTTDFGRFADIQLDLALQADITVHA